MLHVNFKIVLTASLLALRPVGAFGKDIAFGARGVGFNFRAGQIGRSVHRLDVSSELCCPGVKPRRWPRHSLHASV